MSRTALIEGSFFLAVGLVAMAGGLHIMAQPNDVPTTQEIVGPGSYVLFLSIGLIVVGIVHIAANYRENSHVRRMAQDKTMRMQVIGMIVVLAIYILIINLVGYLAASVFFFLAQFRIAGVKRWRTNVILSLAVGASYYIVFVRLCNIGFPF